MDATTCVDASFALKLVLATGARGATISIVGTILEGGRAPGLSLV
jgi:hypothetical protein